MKDSTPEEIFQTIELLSTRVFSRSRWDFMISKLKSLRCSSLTQTIEWQRFMALMRHWFLLELEPTCRVEDLKQTLKSMISIHSKLWMRLRISLIKIHIRSMKAKSRGESWKMFERFPVDQMITNKRPKLEAEEIERKEKRVE